MRILGVFIFLGLFMSLSASLEAADSTKTSFANSIVSSGNAGGGVPIGTIIAWPSASNPSDMENWLECNGQAVNQSQYPELHALVGGNVPDYRGMFLRGHGSQSHTQNNGSRVGLTETVHSSGNLGEIQGDSVRNIQGSFLSGGHDWMYANNADRVDGNLFTQDHSYNYESGASGAYYRLLKFNFDASGIVPTASENRPVNKAVRYFIRAKD